MLNLKFSVKHLNNMEKREILELLFSLGCKWLDMSMGVKHLDANHYYVTNDRITHGKLESTFTTTECWTYCTLPQLRKMVNEKNNLEEVKIPNKDKLINLELTLEEVLALYCITGSIGGDTLLRHGLSIVYRKIDLEVRENLGYDYTFMTQPVGVSISNLNEAYVMGCRKIFNTKTEEELEIEELNKTILLAENKIREILSKKESK